jgi:hypothetical protein
MFIPRIFRPCVFGLPYNKTPEYTKFTRMGLNMVNLNVMGFNVLAQKGGMVTSWILLSKGQ